MAWQGKALTASKVTLEDEENWDEEPWLPPLETLSEVRPILSSQEDKWKLMVDQDPCSGSVAGDSGHGTMATTSEAESINSSEELIRASTRIPRATDSQPLVGINQRPRHKRFVRCECLIRCDIYLTVKM